MAQETERWPGAGEIWFALKLLLAPPHVRQGNDDRGEDAVAADRFALADIKAEIGDDAELILDSGVRRGTDIVKAIALGASSCLVGRAALYGLAAAGQPGMARALDILRAELDNACALCGVTSVTGLGKTDLKPSALFSAVEAP